MANAVAGVAQLAMITGVYDLGALARGLVGKTPNDPLGVEDWRRERLQLFVRSGGAIRL